VTPDVVVVGTSGGGLIAGIALAIKARVPGAKFYSAEPRIRRHAALVQERQERDQSADERHHLRRADDQHAGRTHLGDQQEARREGQRQRRRGRRAVAFCVPRAEPGGRAGGAIGLAALLAASSISRASVVAVLSGGNVDAELFSSADRGLGFDPPGRARSRLSGIALVRTGNGLVIARTLSANNSANGESDRFSI